MAQSCTLSSQHQIDVAMLKHFKNKDKIKMEKILEKLPTIINIILIIYLIIKIYIIIENEQKIKNIMINNNLISQQYLNKRILKKIKNLTK